MITYRNLLLAVAAVAVAAVLAENIVLVHRMAKLEAMITARTEVPSLKVGDAIPQASLQNLSGHLVSFTADEPKILFVFSSNCPFCKKNFANWKVIEKRVGKSNVLYLSIDPADVVRPFAQQHEIEDETLVLSRAQAQALKSFRIPETIEVARGKVEAITIGVLTPAETNRIGLMN